MKVLLVLSVILAAAVVHADHAGTCPDNLAPTCKCADGTVVILNTPVARALCSGQGFPTCLCTDGSVPVEPKDHDVDGVDDHAHKDHDVDGVDDHDHKSPCANRAEPLCSGWFQTFIKIFFFIQQISSIQDIL